MKVRWLWVAVVYGALALVSAAVVIALRRSSPLLHPEPVLALEPGVRELVSGAAGMVLAAVVVVSTRVMARRVRWAQHMHQELRPFVAGMSLKVIVLAALLSSIGEELLFRSLLQPHVGLVAQAVLFGLAHQMPGSSRWWWMLWAAVVGLAFGAGFEVTGSLAGPLVAHATINAVNLVFIRDHDPVASS